MRYLCLQVLLLAFVMALYCKREIDFVLLYFFSVLIGCSQLIPALITSQQKLWQPHLVDPSLSCGILQEQKLAELNLTARITTLGDIRPSIQAPGYSKVDIVIGHISGTYKYMCGFAHIC